MSCKYFKLTDYTTLTSLSTRTGTMQTHACLTYDLTTRKIWDIDPGKRLRYLAVPPTLSTYFFHLFLVEGNVLLSSHSSPYLDQRLISWQRFYQKLKDSINEDVICHFDPPLVALERLDSHQVGQLLPFWNRRLRLHPCETHDILYQQRLLLVSPRHSFDFAVGLLCRF